MNNLHACPDSRKSRHAKTQGIVATTSFHRRVEIDVSHAHIFSPEPDIVENGLKNLADGRVANHLLRRMRRTANYRNHH